MDCKSIERFFGKSLCRSGDTDRCHYVTSIVQYWRSHATQAHFIFFVIKRESLLANQCQFSEKVLAVSDCTVGEARQPSLRDDLVHFLLIHSTQQSFSDPAAVQMQSLSDISRKPYGLLRINL